MKAQAWVSLGLLILSGGCVEAPTQLSEVEQAARPSMAVDASAGITSTVLINEVDADTPGADTQEFIELYDGGVGNTQLDGLVVVFYNGSSDVSYNAFDLDGLTTDAHGFFLLGNAAVNPAPDIIFPNNGLQNGPDGVALYMGDASAFPSGTAATTDNLIDAVVYDTDDADDLGLLALLNAGQPQVNEAGAGDKDNHSNQRIPNGSGGGRNTETIAQAPATAPTARSPTSTRPMRSSPTSLARCRWPTPASPTAGAASSSSTRCTTTISTGLPPVRRSTPFSAGLSTGWTWSAPSGTPRPATATARSRRCR